MAKLLKDQVIYNRGLGETFSDELTSSRPPKYKAWDKSMITKAISAVTKGGASVREATLKFGIPKSTLGDRVAEY